LGRKSCLLYGQFAHQRPFIEVREMGKKAQAEWLTRLLQSQPSGGEKRHSPLHLIIGVEKKKKKKKAKRARHRWHTQKWRVNEAGFSSATWKVTGLN